MIYLRVYLSVYIHAQYVGKNESISRERHTESEGVREREREREWGRQRSAECRVLNTHSSIGLRAPRAARSSRRLSVELGLRRVEMRKKSSPLL